MKVVPLDWPLAQKLSHKVRPEDVRECMVMGRTAEMALCAGILFGRGHAVVEKDGSVDGSPIGAFGFTLTGTVWSLWQPLSQRQAFRVLKETPAWVKDMVHESGRRYLWNYVDADNGPALGWLRASRCFDFGPPQLFGGITLIPFQTNVEGAAHV